ALDFVEEARASTTLTRAVQRIARRSGIGEPRPGEAILDELPQVRTNGKLVVHEAEDVGGADVRAESLTVEPEHDLQDLVSLLQGGHGIGGAAAFLEQAVHVLEGSLHRRADPRS